METLLSTFGNALLLVQEQMRASVTRFGDDDFAPNFYHVLLSGVSFSEEERRRFRKDLMEEITGFAEANEWRFSSRPSILLQVVDGDENSEPCIVTASLVDRFGRLEIADDMGDRVVDLPEPTALIGREHDAPPRDFIPIVDASRSLSREHLRLTFDGAGWTAEIIGRNRTELNGVEVETGSRHRLKQGDVVISSPHRIRMVEELPTQVDLREDHHLDQRTS